MTHPFPKEEPTRMAQPLPISLRPNRYPRKVNTAITEEDFRVVKELAHRIGISPSAVIREALRPGLTALRRKHQRAGTLADVFSKDGAAT